MKQEDWARQLEHRLADHQEAPSHDLWTDIEARMAEGSGKAARLATLRRWSAVAAAVLLTRRRIPVVAATGAGGCG